MDAIVSDALNEICALASSGIALQNLWPRLKNSLASADLPLCKGVKQAIWNGLLKVPALRFEAPNSPLSSRDPSIQSVEDAETIGVKIFAADHLIDSSLGLYDLTNAAGVEISPLQRQTLERLAIARTNGITQSQLCKEFGMQGNKLFYAVRYLECQGLIVRKSTVVRTKESEVEGENGIKITPVVNTNLMHLYRYGKHLNMSSQQRFEITKPDTLESLNYVEESTSSKDGIAGEFTKEDVLVKDYLPAMRAVCSKLEETSGKVLVVSDIKMSLGYRRTQGHRAWRTICKRLKEAHLVEEFQAKVNKKVVMCLRLLKRMEPNLANDVPDPNQPMKCGKRGQVTDQLVELPIDQQIHDIIDAEGPKGILVTELCGRLGIHNKRNHTRICHMFSRFGVQQQPESLNRSILYRVWTQRNFPGTCKDVIDNNQLSPHLTRDLGQSSASLPLHSICQELISPDEWKTTNAGKDLESFNKSLSTGESGKLLTCGTNPLKSVQETASTEEDVKPDVNFKVTELGSGPPPVTPPSISLAQPDSVGSKRYPCITLTATIAQREKRILEILQEEKFILTVELYRCLEGFEKDKPTTMARKTLTRHLNKLQQEGLCKCYRVSVPILSNCGRNRMIEVVLHPSVDGLCPEVLGQIYKRMRHFEMQIRGRGLARLKSDNSVPVLTDVKRTLTHVDSDAQTYKAQVMRSNGFVPAKMVRVKLLHNFLWAHLSSLPDWVDSLPSGSHAHDLKIPHSTCKLFALHEALKAMPLEIFLQVVGSPQKYDDLVENCKLGLCLSELPVQEYKHLMDTQATGRLSLVINILCRLKLIRLVNEGQMGEMGVVPCAILRHAMELKPYIEEPALSALPLSNVNSSDLRPRVRHDFILSKREAVDAYWKTLEYCYAAVDPIAASNAFPGSAVHEVCLFRSWSSDRVMTAEQRSELFKRVANDDPEKKISFKECDKIARDLNLTLEQVLRFCYDRQRSQNSRFLGDKKSKEQESNLATKGCVPTAWKRKSSSADISSKRLKMDTVHEELNGLTTPVSSDNELKSVDPKYRCITPTEEEQASDIKEFGPTEEERDSIISQCAISRLIPSRRRKFMWTRESDRQLLMQYAKHRASLGVKFTRVDWSSLPDLPAPPHTCRRRMSILNSNLNLRRAVMKLCNLLGERYTEKLNSLKEKEQIIKDSGLGLIRPIMFDDASDPISQGRRWDDFEDPTVNMALEEVLRCKQIAKVEASKRKEIEPEKKWSDLSLEAHASCSQDGDKQHSLVSSSDHVKVRQKDSSPFLSAGRTKRRSSNRLPKKFLNRLNNGGPAFGRKACESLAVANAVELLKVVFLSNSSAPDVPKLLIETLRKYSEDDIFAAFNYLRNKNFMVNGQGSQPFVLSKRFWHNASSSPFPINTGKRAAKFAAWLHEREKEIMEDGINVYQDLQCGDIFHLFALVSAGELFVSPCLPDEGVGEMEEQRDTKRKTDNSELSCGEKVKKHKSHLQTDSEFCSRREKGFPGISVSISRAALSGAEALEFISHKIDRYNSGSDLISLGSRAVSDYMHPSESYSTGISVGMNLDDSLWEDLAKYAELSMSTYAVCGQGIYFSPALLKTVHNAICEAGQQGLNLEEVSQVQGMQGNKTAEIVVDALQLFGLVVKVNAYNTVNVIDASYRPKYFLSSTKGPYQYVKPASLRTSLGTNVESSLTVTPEFNIEASSLQKETTVNLFDGHKVTILDLPNIGSQSCKEAHPGAGSLRFEDNMQDEASASEMVASKNCTASESSNASWPILPWMNANGGTNTVVYKGLRRRVMGIVMQNPGIFEEDLLKHMDVLNPQSCRKLLELIVLDNHLIVREMHQTTFSGPPPLLGGLLGCNLNKPELVCRKHFFANPMSTSLL